MLMNLVADENLNRLVICLWLSIPNLASARLSGAKSDHHEKLYVCLYVQ